MKNFKITTLAVAFLLTSVFAAHAQGAAMKIAFLDLSRIFDTYEKTKEYDAILEGEHNAYEKDRNEKLEKLKEAQGKLAALTEAERGWLSKNAISPTIEQSAKLAKVTCLPSFSR